MRVLVWKLTLKRQVSVLLLLVIFIPDLQLPVNQSQSIEVTRNQAEADFPTSIVFYLSAQGEHTIETVELNYGIDVLACAETVTRAVPEDFTPGKTIELSWEWDMYQSGSIPTGTSVWWQWVLVDNRGQQFETDIETLRFMDTNHNWRTIQSENIDLYYYEGTSGFAEQLLTAGETALLAIEDLLEYRADDTIQVFIYASTQEMHDAMLYTPSWTGGYAMPEYRLLVIGVEPSELEWGKSTMAHELTHIVVGRMTFSCVTSVPRWLDEGLAMTIEGKPDYGDALLQQAIETDSLLSIRQIEGYFSGDDDTAILSYAQSLSMTTFLIDEYGADNIRELLGAFKDGMTDDDALMSVYGFDRDGLEALWRASIGASPIDAVAEETESTPTRTPYPTIAPLGAAEMTTLTALPPSASPPDQMTTPTAPGEEVAEQATEPVSVTPAAGAETSTTTPIMGIGMLPFLLIAICLVAIVLIGGGLALVLILRARNRSDA
jgi:hypothetical protein